MTMSLCKIDTPQSVTFHDAEELERVTIIRSGHKGRYVVVIESADLSIVPHSASNKEEIMHYFNIDVLEYLPDK